MMMQVPLIDLKAQQASVMDEMSASVERILREADFVLGEDVTQFEQEYAAFCETRYAVGVDSGLSAIQLLLIARGIGPGDEVIVPANSFIATAAAVSLAGATPVIVDIEDASQNIDLDGCRRALTPRTKAVIPVHLYGKPVDMDPLLDWAAEHGLIVIEDGAQAHGARYKGKRAGSLAHGGAFSFYPAKNLGAAGEAGIVTTDDSDIAEMIRALRNCGQRERYYHEFTPYNHRIDTLQAAILRVKLPHIEQWNAQRRRHACLYEELLSAVDEIILPTALETSEPVWHLFVIRVSERDSLRQHLSEQGIGTGLHYPLPIHLQPAYEHLGYTTGSLPVAEAHAGQVLSLPMYPEMTEEAVRYVADAVRSYFAAR